jgi:hypothetical protein
MVAWPKAHRNQETASWRVRYVGQNASELAETQLTPYITVLSALRTRPNFPSNNLTAAQSAMNAGINHPSVQNAKDTVVNGEVSRLHSLSGVFEQSLTLVARHRCITHLF